jgi:hypothetical protein
MCTWCRYSAAGVGAGVLAESLEELEELEVSLVDAGTDEPDLPLSVL